MLLKTYLEFGSIIKGKKKRYELLKGELYNSYMLSRYFKDLYYLNSFKSKKDFNFLSQKLHHKTDLKFNFVNFSLLKVSNPNSFYEFGQTLFEKIYFIKFISKFFGENKNLNIKWYGNDISKMFNFFCNNFYKNLKIKVFDSPNYNCIKNSVFFSKGVSLLYYKNNINFLNRVLKTSKCGSFDFSLSRKRKITYLATGYQMHYPSISSFFDIVKRIKNKKFFVRNIKKHDKKIYFELVYGNKKIIDSFLTYHKKKREKYKNNKNVTKTFDLNSKFIDIFDEKIVKKFFGS
jgi:hypothetical protein|tara:strand:- start:755 stop:1624 length:870 start_codon:yes stop_codon:yes gene_type:complete